MGFWAAANSVSVSVTINKVPQKFFQNMSTIFGQINATIEATIPQLLKHMSCFMQKLVNQEADAPAYSNNNSIFPLMSILINWQTGLHTDSGSNANLVETSVTFGNYEGGKFLFPQLDVEANFGPGSFAVFCSKAFTHGVKEWTRVERRCIVLYVHADVFDSLEPASMKDWTSLIASLTNFLLYPPDP